MFRPWGSYDSIDSGERFQVKRLTVKPGACMSLQLHHHRAEHWIVVAGTARITRGEETFLLEENQSTYIPLGTKHRIENPGKIPLHMIEVQSGTYLGEDDIVRFEDRYGREGQTVDGVDACDVLTCMTLSGTRSTLSQGGRMQSTGSAISRSARSGPRGIEPGVVPSIDCTRHVSATESGSHWRPNAARCRFRSVEHRRG